MAAPTGSHARPSTTKPHECWVSGNFAVFSAFTSSRRVQHNVDNLSPLCRSLKAADRCLPSTFSSGSRTDAASCPGPALRATGCHRAGPARSAIRVRCANAVRGTRAPPARPARRARERPGPAVVTARSMLGQRSLNEPPGHPTTASAVHRGRSSAGSTGSAPGFSCNSLGGKPRPDRRRWPARSR